MESLEKVKSNSELEQLVCISMIELNLNQVIEELLKLQEHHRKAIRDALSVSICDPNTNLESTILTVIEDYFMTFGIDFEDAFKTLSSKTRKRDIIYCRNFYCWYMYFNTPLSTENVGTNIDIDHATVIHGMKNYIKLLQQNIHEILYLERMMKPFKMNFQSCIKAKYAVIVKYLERENITPNSINIK